MSQLSFAVAVAFAAVALPAFRSASSVWLCLALSGALLTAPASASSCIDEDRVAAEATPTTPGLPKASPVPADPRATLSALVQDAVARSHAVGASKLLSEAALDDVEEARAARAIQASVGGGVGPGGSRTVAGSENSAAQLRATLNVSQLLYDGGRSERLADWRTQLAESARWGLLTVQEQLALSTVALSLERSRYRMTSQVFRGHVRKMSCLVEALETIVRTDRGRASELVQARKSMQQAELALSQTQYATRQVEVRLRRLVGDGLPGTEGMSTVFARLPDLAQLVADVERSREINQLDAQAAAARRYADAVAAGGKPQLSWNMAGNAAAGAGGSQGSTRSGSYSVGLTVNVPLLSPGIEPASNAARKRAQAAQMQRADALETRRFRVAEVHEQAQGALDRAQRVAEVLRNSEQVRNFTLQQWQQLGRRSLFDVMAAESDHFGLRVAYVNALHDVQQLNAQILSLGLGVSEWLR
jgi:outer membrane protein TolC